MSYTIAFIDKTVLTDRTDLGTNYSADNVRNAILDAQRFDLFDIIGKKLYERFDTDIDNNDYGTDSYKTDHPKYYELMEDYLVPYLTWASYSRVLDFYISPRNNGLGVRGSEGTTAATTAQYSLKKSQAKEKMDYFERKLIERISHDSSDFEELQEQVDYNSDSPQYYEGRKKQAYFGRGSKRIFKRFDL